MPAFLDAHLGLISQLAQGTYFSPRCTNMLFQVRGPVFLHLGLVSVGRWRRREGGGRGPPHGPPLPR